MFFIFKSEIGSSSSTFKIVEEPETTTEPATTAAVFAPSALPANVSVLLPIDNNVYPVIAKYAMLSGNCPGGAICSSPLVVDPATCGQMCLAGGSNCVGFTYDFINGRCHLKNVTCSEVAATLGARYYTKVDQTPIASELTTSQLCGASTVEDISVQSNRRKSSRGNTGLRIEMSIVMLTTSFFLSTAFIFPL